MIDCFCTDIGDTIRDSQFLADSFYTTVSFTPPLDSFYTIKALGELIPGKISYQKAIFIHNSYSHIHYKWLKIDSYLVSKKKNAGTQLAVIHLKHTQYLSIISNTMISYSEKPFTLLFSHGNNSALGQNYPLLIDLCTLLKCDIISYDYSGYGKSTGSASEEVIYSNIKTVWSFMKIILNIKAEEVILMGNTLGTAPTVELGIKRSLSDKIRGIILISPISSGVSLIKNQKTKAMETKYVYCNKLKVSKIKCPVFLVHGRSDNVLPIEHSFEIEKYLSSVYTWYPKQGDNTNIITTFRTKFMTKCKHFLGYLIKDKLDFCEIKKDKENSSREKIINIKRNNYFRDECESVSGSSSSNSIIILQEQNEDKNKPLNAEVSIQKESVVFEIQGTSLANSDFEQDSSNVYYS